MQKIKNYLNRMKGMERVIFESTCSVVLCLSAYFIALFCGASQEVALVITIAAAAFAAAAFAAAAAAVVVAVAAFAAVAAVAFAAAAAAAVAAFAVAAFAVAAVDDYKIKWWKTFSFYFVLGSLLFVSFIYSTPLVTALFVVSALTIVAIALKPKGIAYLKNHPPVIPKPRTERAEYGKHPWRLTVVETSRQPRQSLAARLYRVLYERYALAR